MYHLTRILYAQTIEGWFLDRPLSQIHREDFASWCGWAFYDRHLKDLTPEEQSENNQIVDYIEAGTQWTFPPGK